MDPMNPNSFSADSIDIEKCLKEVLDCFLVKKDGAPPALLEESIRYSLLAPGKRIRPRLSLACSSMVGVPQSAAVPAALVTELLHCMTLIHDDLPCMDNDDFRRGQLSNHKKYGESIALLAGNSLLCLAFELFLEVFKTVPAPQCLSGYQILTWAIGPRGVHGGQAAEFAVEKFTLEDIYRIHAQKTGALFQAAIIIPKALVGIADDHPKGEAILQFAENIGKAFQAYDDLEDEGPIEPKNLRYFLPVMEIKKQVQEKLSEACKKLDSVWGSSSQSLVQIAHEILTRMEGLEKK